MKEYFALDKINPKFNRVYAISTEIYLLKLIVTILKRRALKIQVTTHHLKSKKKISQNTGRIAEVFDYDYKIIIKCNENNLLHTIVVSNTFGA